MRISDWSSDVCSSDLRAVVDKLNLPRLHSHLVEAAEQCGRTALPELGEMVKLQNLLKNWSQSRHLFFADEQGGTPMDEALSAHAVPAAFLIGPEGGLDEEDRAAIRAHHPTTSEEMRVGKMCGI